MHTNLNRPAKLWLSFKDLYRIHEPLHWPLFSSPVDSDQSLNLRSGTFERQYIQNLQVIDNQKKLTQLSRTIERWETTRRPFFTPALLHIGEKNILCDLWNPWSPYVWLCGVTVSASWTELSQALLQECCGAPCGPNLTHTKPQAMNFTLVLLAITVIYTFVYFNIVEFLFLGL